MITKTETLFNVYTILENGTEVLVKDNLPSSELSNFLEVYSYGQKRQNIRIALSE